MKPTEQQIKEIWEWCGLTYEYSPYTNSSGSYWYILRDTEGSTITCNGIGWFPIGRQLSIDLNNLFEYAVPKLKKEIPPARFYAILREWVDQIMRGDNPADSLFWLIGNEALWQVKENNG